MRLGPMLPMNTALTQAMDQHGLGERIAGDAFDDDYAERNDKLVRLVEAGRLLDPIRARRFEEIRCPVCGDFAGGGC